MWLLNCIMGMYRHTQLKWYFTKNSNRLERWFSCQSTSFWMTWIWFPDLEAKRQVCFEFLYLPLHGLSGIDLRSQGLYSRYFYPWPILPTSKVYHVCAGTFGGQMSVGSPRPRVIAPDSFKLTVGARIQTWILWRSSKCFFSPFLPDPPDLFEGEQAVSLSILLHLWGQKEVTDLLVQELQVMKLSTGL